MISLRAKWHFTDIRVDEIITLQLSCRSKLHLWLANGLRWLGPFCIFPSLGFFERLQDSILGSVKWSLCIITRWTRSGGLFGSLNYFKLQIWPYWWFRLVWALNHQNWVRNLNYWPQPIRLYVFSIRLQSTRFDRICWSTILWLRVGLFQLRIRSLKPNQLSEQVFIAHLKLFWYEYSVLKRFNEARIRDLGILKTCGLYLIDQAPQSIQLNLDFSVTLAV